jgi:sec-independent protein translocase protein TatA
MRVLEPWHLIVLLVVVLVLFGGKRLPDAARGLGRSMRIFKSEIKQMHDDEKPAPPSTPPVEGKIVEPSARETSTESRAGEPHEPHA